MDGETVQFDRNPLTFYLYLAASVLWLMSFMMNFAFGELGLAALNALTTFLFLAAAFLFRKPYIRLTDQALSVNIAPIRSFTDIPWSQIRQATRRADKFVEISTVDGKSVKLYLKTLTSAQRPVLISALEQRLGPLPIA